MSSQYLTNLNPPPPQSLLEYDIEPGVVFISTTTEQLFVNLIITVTNTTGAVVDCMQFQFGFLAGALAGNLTTVDQAASVTASSDQSEWRITASGFSENNPHLYLFTATPSGVDEFLTLGTGSSLTFHLSNILVDQSVGEGDAEFTIIEQTGTNRRTRNTVSGVISITKETSTLAITNFRVNPPTPIPPGTRIELSWILTGSDHWQLFDADSATLLYDSSTGTPPNLTQWPVPPVQLTPAATTTYELIAWAGQIFTNAFEVAQVTNPRFTSIGAPAANPTSVDTGRTSTVSWQTADANYVIVTASAYTSPQLPPDANGNGQLQVNPQLTTTYTVTPYGAGGEKGESGQVVVSVNPPRVLSISAAPSLYEAGETISLSWQTQSGISAALSRTSYGSNEVIDMGGVDLNSDAHPVNPPNGLTTYFLTVEGQGQTTGEVVVANPPQIIDTLDTFQADILYDNVNRLLWELLRGSDQIRWRNAANSNLVGQTALVGDDLIAMAFDGEYIWVTSSKAGLIQIQASNGNIVATGIQQKNLKEPSFIAYDSVNQFLWVVHNLVSAVSRIKTGDLTLAGPDIAFGLVAARPALAGVNAWFADTGEQQLCIVQASSGTIMKRLPSNAGCLTFDGTNVWAGCGDGHLRKFDGEGNVIASYRAADCAVNDILFDGTNIWTANFDDETVSMINAANGTLLGSFPAGPNPQSLAFDGASVWILCSDLGTQSSLILKLVAAAPPSK